MKERTGHICIGGTFSPIHSGHLLLLEEAFLRGRKVSVGLTSDEMAVRTRTRDVDRFDVRKRALEKVLGEMSNKYDAPFSISEITDRFGFAIRPEIDSIVVSEETENTVDEIDEERRKQGLGPLVRYVIPMMGAGDGNRISSTRIFHGEIDVDGKILAEDLRPLCVHSGSKNADKAKGLMKAFTRHASGVQLLQYEIAPEIDDVNEEAVIQGARSRCIKVMEKNTGGRIGPKDYFVGIETGMVEMKGRWFQFHCCVIMNDGEEGIGLSSGVEVPDDMIESMMIYRGTSWDPRDISGNPRSLVENLSAGSISRSSLVEECCKMALLSLSNHKRSKGVEK